MELTLTNTLNLTLNLNPYQFICNPKVIPSFSTLGALLVPIFSQNRDETSHTGVPLTQCMIIGTGILELITPDKDQVAGGIQFLDHKVQWSLFFQLSFVAYKEVMDVLTLNISVDIKTDFCLCELKVKSCTD